MNFYNKETLLKDIKEAFREIKAEAGYGAYYTDDNLKCCPMTALYCYATKLPISQAFSSMILNYLGRKYNVSVGSIEDFTIGFDGRKPKNKEKFDEEAFNLGVYCRGELNPCPIS